MLRDLGMGKRNIEEKIIEESENLVKSFATHNGEAILDLKIKLQIHNYSTAIQNATHRTIN